MTYVEKLTLRVIVMMAMPKKKDKTELLKPINNAQIE